MATLVQELTEDGAYDLDADPAVEASEATWLDADSVSPALARDKKLAVRVQALERAIAARGDGALERLHAHGQLLVARERRRHAVRVEPRRLARFDRRVRIEVVGAVFCELLDQGGHFSYV